MPRENVMDGETSERFRDLLARGLRQYRLVPGRVPPLHQSRPTARDLMYKRLGLQRDVAPLRDAGYVNDAQIAKLVENALRRPVRLWMARLALFAVQKSRAVAKWRRENGGFDSDSWYQEVRRLERAGEPFAMTPFPPIEPAPRDALLRALIAPYDVEGLAKYICDSLGIKGFLSKSEHDNAVETVTAALQRSRGVWRKNYVNHLTTANGLREVTMFETHLLQPEGESILVRYPVLTDRMSDIKPDGGEDPTFPERLSALLRDGEEIDAKRRARERNAKPHASTQNPNSKTGRFRLTAE